MNFLLAERTPEYPLLEGVRLEMVKTVNSSNSNFFIYNMLEKSLLELGKQTSISMAKSLEQFRENKGHFLMILQTIPKAVRDALIMNSVAYDFHPARAGNKCSVLYSLEYPGVYAIGISIEGREGCCLSSDEWARVIKGIEDYSTACGLWKTKDEDAMTQDELDLIEAAIKVDDVWRKREPDGRPGFLGATSKSRVKQAQGIVQEYVEWLKKRVDTSLDPDIQKDVYQKQSPIYVGCTNQKLHERMRDHLINVEGRENNLRSTNSLLGLTLSVIKQVLGLTPETIGIPVTIVWNTSHLGCAQSLGIILASSLYTHGGFNISPSGNHVGDDKDSPANRHYLLTEHSDTIDNVDDFEREMEKLEDIWRMLQETDSHLSDPVWAETEELVREARGLVEEYKNAVENQRAIIRKCQQIKLAHQRETEMLERFTQLLQGLVPATPRTPRGGPSGSSNQD
ncbi:hypothetical protein QBC44DRAFT_388997 [Cladorrhinum sp. PSN332]|nr:hypothetical protein QBC44DRAFT_388997 [Cladorrhinum sp. PSN332]